MVAYKNKPALIEEKTTQGQGYDLSSSETKSRYNISDTYAPFENKVVRSNPALLQNRFMDDECLDGLIQNHVNDRHYNTVSETSRKRTAESESPEVSTYKDYLSRPIWFYKIMEILENNDGSKDKKKTSEVLNRWRTLGLPIMLLGSGSFHAFLHIP